jgi:chromosomal replication initiation ATPase DnaA
MTSRIQEVERIISEVFSVHPNFKENWVRRRRFINPKKVLCSILYNKEELTMQEIADFMGYDNHTSVLFHIRSMEGIYESDEKFKEKVDIVYDNIYKLYVIPKTV